MGKKRLEEKCTKMFMVMNPRNGILDAFYFFCILSQFSATDIYCSWIPAEGKVNGRELFRSELEHSCGRETLLYGTVNWHAQSPGSKGKPCLSLFPSDPTGVCFLHERAFLFLPHPQRIFSSKQIMEPLGKWVWIGVLALPQKSQEIRISCWRRLGPSFLICNMGRTALPR